MRFFCFLFSISLLCFQPVVTGKEESFSYTAHKFKKKFQSWLNRVQVVKLRSSSNYFMKDGILRWKMDILVKESSRNIYWIPEAVSVSMGALTPSIGKEIGFLELWAPRHITLSQLRDDNIEAMGISLNPISVIFMCGLYSHFHKKISHKTLSKVIRAWPILGAATNFLSLSSLLGTPWLLFFWNIAKSLSTGPAGAAYWGLWSSHGTWHGLQLHVGRSVPLAISLPKLTFQLDEASLLKKASAGEIVIK